MTRSVLLEAWIEQVREQAATIRTKVPPGARLWARVDFRLYSHVTDQPEWDLDNLVKPFFDALAAAEFFGPPTPGRPHNGDERVDNLQLRKTTVATLEEAGARIELFAITEP